MTTSEPKFFLFGRTGGSPKWWQDLVNDNAKSLLSGNPHFNEWLSDTFGKGLVTFHADADEYGVYTDRYLTFASEEAKTMFFLKIGISGA